MERQLLDCPLPPNSEMLDSASIAGKMQGNGNYRFKNYSGEEHCYQIQFFKNIPVGFETSIWEEFLNNDLRGH